MFVIPSFPFKFLIIRRQKTEHKHMYWYEQWACFWVTAVTSVWVKTNCPSVTSWLDNYWYSLSFLSSLFSSVVVAELRVDCGEMLSARWPAEYWGKPGWRADPSGVWSHAPSHSLLSTATITGHHTNYSAPQSRVQTLPTSRWCHSLSLPT